MNRHLGRKAIVLAMYIKYKFIYIITISCLTISMMPGNVFAYPVQVADIGAYQFYQKAYNLNRIISSKYNYDKLKHIGAITKNSPYDLYLTALGEHGHGAIVTLFANKAGYVSKITVYANCNDGLAEQYLGMAVANILYSLGLRKDEVEKITGNITRIPCNDVWGVAIKRRIYLERYIENNEVLVFRITAEDR